MANQSVSITFPEGFCTGFVLQFPVCYFVHPEMFTPVPKHIDPKVEVQCLVANYYSTIGGHTGHITTHLQATVRLQGYPCTNLLLHEIFFIKCGAV